MKIFISYPHDEIHYVREFISRLNETPGYEIWWDQSLLGGDEWWQKILDQIEDCHVFLIFLSPKSISSSFCIEEVQYALRLEKKIIPLILKPCIVPTFLTQIQYLSVFDRSLEVAVRQSIPAIERAYKARSRSKTILPRPPLPKASDTSGEYSSVNYVEQNQSQDTSILNQTSTVFDLGDIFFNVYIVGKNGSGKSSMLERLKEYIALSEEIGSISFVQQSLFQKPLNCVFVHKISEKIHFFETPAISGSEKDENITRAILGMRQLTEQRVSRLKLCHSTAAEEFPVSYWKSVRMKPTYFPRRIIYTISTNNSLMISEKSFLEALISLYGAKIAIVINLFNESPSSLSSSTKLFIQNVRKFLSTINMRHDNTYNISVFLLNVSNGEGVPQLFNFIFKAKE